MTWYISANLKRNFPIDMAKRTRPWTAHWQAWTFITFALVTDFLITVDLVGGVSAFFKEPAIAAWCAIVLAVFVSWAIYAASNENRARQLETEGVMAMGAYHIEFSNVVTMLPGLLGSVFLDSDWPNEKFTTDLESVIADLESIPVFKISAYDREIADAIIAAISGLKHVKRANKQMGPFVKKIAQREISQVMVDLTKLSRAFENSDPWVRKYPIPAPQAV